MSNDSNQTVNMFLERLNISPQEVENSFPALYNNLHPILTALKELRSLRQEIQKKEELITGLQAEAISQKNSVRIPSVPESKLVNWRSYFHKLQNQFNDQKYKNQNWIDVRLDFVKCFISKNNIWLDKHSLKSFFSLTEDAVLIKLKKYHDEGWLERNIPEKYHQAYKYRLDISKTKFQIDL